MTPAASEPASRTENKTDPVPAAVKEKRFDWPLCYEAEKFILNQIQAFLARNTFASTLAV